MSRFDDIDNKRLQTWNRCNYAYNLYTEKGAAPMTEYIEQFHQSEKTMIYAMFNYIKAKGYDVVRKEMVNVH